MSGEAVLDFDAPARTDIEEIDDQRARVMAELIYPTSQKAYERAIVRIPRRMWEHPEIQRLRNSTARFKCVVSGARSGKTLNALTWIVSQAILHPHTSSLLCSPTFAQSKSVFWNQVLSLIPPELIHAISWSELTITLKNGSELQAASTEVPGRLEGRMRNFILLDEAGDNGMSKDGESIWDANLRILLSDTNGQAYIIGRARQTYSRWFADLATRAQTDKQGDYAYFSWPSADILDPSEIEKLKRTMSADLFEQEYGSKFRSLVGGAYAMYDQTTHEREVMYQPNLPLFVGCDFNVNPCVFHVIQVLADDFINVLDQIVGYNTNVWLMEKLAKQKLIEICANDPGDGSAEDKARFHLVQWIGDFSGGNRNIAAGLPAWRRLEELFEDWPGCKFAKRTNPGVTERILEVNGRFLNAHSQVRFAHSSKCILLRNDFLNLTWEEALKQQTTNRMLTHASDSVGYVVYWVMHPGGFSVGQSTGGR